jgi:hypothetical protein
MIKNSIQKIHSSNIESSLYLKGSFAARTLLREVKCLAWSLTQIFPTGLSFFTDLVYVEFSSFLIDFSPKFRQEPGAPKPKLTYLVLLYQ